MRIVVWNCAMAFHKKYESLMRLRPDIAVISECANLEILARAAPSFQPNSSTWIGDNPKKGLGVFTFGAFTGIKSPIYRPDFPYIAPILINGPTSFNLLAVWACHRKETILERKGPLMRALSAYEPFVAHSPAVVAGDFNDNTQWDKRGNLFQQATNVTELNRLGLQSAYHFERKAEQGAEPEPTIYWRNRTRDGPKYHIDYCFIPDAWMRSISAVYVGAFDDWVGNGLSDHVPLTVQIG